MRSARKLVYAATANEPCPSGRRSMVCSKESPKTVRMFPALIRRTNEAASVLPTVTDGMQRGLSDKRDTHKDIVLERTVLVMEKV